MRFAFARLFFATSVLFLYSTNATADIEHGSLEAFVARAMDMQSHISTQLDKQKSSTSPRREHSYKASQGIVIAAGGRDQLANALATIQVLRNDLSCHLHIEVIYYGQEEANATLIKRLEGLKGVKILDAATMPVPRYHYIPAKKIGYFKKIMAIYVSSFDELLYLDADSHPLQNPTSWFEWPEFKQHGNVFWSDYMGPGRYESVKPDIYGAFRMPVPWENKPDWKCTESGQFLFDRRKHLDVMEWILFINAQHETTYRYIYGDKDSFELAFSLARKAKQFNRVAYGPRAAYRHLVKENNYGHAGMLQTNIKGEPLFFHQVAGGKFYIDTKDLPVPEYASLGITTQALDTMRWGNNIGTLRLYKKSSVDYDSLECKHLDAETASLLAASGQKRFKGCGKKVTTHGVPIPLIPLSRFPMYVSSTIDALAGSFRSIQKDMTSTVSDI